jgi:hypothetical protein
MDELAEMTLQDIQFGGGYGQNIREVCGQQGAAVVSW